MGRNADGTYSVGEFVLCNGQSVESYTSNSYNSRELITVPNYSSFMYERAGCYKLIERRLYLGKSNANPFKPVNLNDNTYLVSDGVFFINKDTLYKQTRFNIHLCDGINIDSLLEENYDFMPNYTSLFKNNMVAIYVGKPLALGDYVIVDNSTTIANGLRHSDGANISINEISYKNPLISNDSINNLNGGLVVKNETFSSPFFDSVIGKCVKIGNYIYTQGKKRADGWSIVRFDLQKGVTSEPKYAPIPSQLSSLRLAEEYSVSISDYSLCFRQGNTFYFTLDYNNWEINTISPYDSSWKMEQIGSEKWATWGTKSMPNGNYRDYKDAYVAFKYGANDSWQPDTSILISSGTLYSGESSASARIDLLRFDGKGSAVWAGEGSKNSGKPNYYLTYNWGIFTHGKKKSGTFKKLGVTVADDLMQSYNYGWTYDVSFRESAVTYGFYWALSNRPWNESEMEAGRKEWQYQAVFNGEEFADSGRTHYESTSSSTMNYKGTYSGVVADRQRVVGDGQWYSNQYSDTGTETLVTPMTIAGFSSGKPVMQSNFIIKNKSTSVQNAKVYVKLR